MIKTGKLYQTQDPTVGLVLCEVVSTYNKPDIDPDCPESVAIVGMVRAMWMSGPHIGKTFAVTRKTFNYRWSLANDT